MKKSTFDRRKPLEPMQHTDNKKFIDIDEVFRSKNPTLYRWLPRFLLNYLKKVVHQEELNRFIETNEHKSEFDFVAAALEEFGVRLQISGLENLPDSGGCIVASNHPLGGLDALALVEAVSRRRRDIQFIVNDILLRLKNLRGIFVGVNKHGRNSKQAIHLLDDIYASGGCTLIFPAGLVSRKRKGFIKDLEWKKSFITKARKHQLPVVPVHISGKNSNFFYNLSNLRTRLGIKANIEMLYLADEMYRQRNRTISIIFGTPVPGTLFESSYTDRDWAMLMREHVYQLEKQGPWIIFDRSAKPYATHH